jgi:hypothetical protein
MWLNYPKAVVEYTKKQIDFIHKILDFYLFLIKKRLRMVLHDDIFTTPAWI